MIKVCPNWNSDIFHCFGDSNICCVSCFCPCIQYGRNIEAFNQKPCIYPCLIFFFLNFLVGSSWIVSHATRGEIRAKYGINGSCLKDCCCHVWCRCCALAQEGREIKARNNFVAVPTQVVKAQQGGMIQPGMMRPGMPNQQPDN